MTSLPEAALRNDVIAAAGFLRAGADVNLRNPEGYTPLMIAAGLGSPQMVELLLTACADVHILEPRTGASALHKAAQGGNVDVACLLLDRGAFIDLQSPTLGHTPLMDAVWHKNLEMVQFLLNRGAKTTLCSHNKRQAKQFVDPQDPGKSGVIADAIEQRDASDRQMVQRQRLMAAVRAENLDEVRRLIAAGESVDERAPMMGEDDDGYTPLGVAARKGYANIVRELLKAGADPRRVDWQIKATPGHKAGYQGHAEVAGVLTEHLAKNRDSGRVIELDAQGPYNGFTALHDAVWHGHLEAARVFVKAGARLDLRTHGGFTARELADLYGYAKIAEWLAGANVEPD